MKHTNTIKNYAVVFSMNKFDKLRFVFESMILLLTFHSINHFNIHLCLINFSNLSFTLHAIENGKLEKKNIIFSKNEIKK